METHKSNLIINNKINNNCMMEEGSWLCMCGCLVLLAVKRPCDSLEICNTRLL